MKRLLFLTALLALSLCSCRTTHGQTGYSFYDVYEQYIPEGCIDYGGYAVHYYGNGVVLVGRPMYNGNWIWEEHYVDFAPIHRYIRQHRINVHEIGFIWLNGRLVFNIMGANCHYTYNPYWGWSYYGYNPYSYNCRPWNYSYHGLSWHKPPRHINYARRDAHRNARIMTYHNNGSSRSNVQRSQPSVSRRQNVGTTTERSSSSYRNKSSRPNSGNSSVRDRSSNKKSSAQPATQNRRSDVQNSKPSGSREQKTETPRRSSSSSPKQSSRQSSGSSSVRSRSTNEKSSAPAKNTRSSSERSSDNSRRR